MIPTPDLSHLRPEDYERVYEPAEDTFLLLDALEEDAQQLIASKPRICLEVGSGSGCVSGFLGTILGSSSLYLCTDINPHACRCTTLTGAKNNVHLNAIETSFSGALHMRLRNSVDILLFNPPYVPTIPEEAVDAQKDRDIQGSWAGGSDGMDVTNRFLEIVPELLSPTGVLYLVALKQNDVPGIQCRMKEQHALKSDVGAGTVAGRTLLKLFHRLSCKDGQAENTYSFFGSVVLMPAVTGLGHCNEYG